MGPTKMLTKVICTGPQLVLPTTILCGAFVKLPGLSVTGSLVSFKIIFSTEAFFSGATFHVAFERFYMSCFMFPVQTKYRSANLLRHEIKDRRRRS